MKRFALYILYRIAGFQGVGIFHFLAQFYGSGHFEIDWDTSLSSQFPVFFFLSAGEYIFHQTTGHTERQFTKGKKIVRARAPILHTCTSTTTF